MGFTNVCENQARIQCTWKCIDRALESFKSREPDAYWETTILGQTNSLARKTPCWKRFEEVWEFARWSKKRRSIFYLSNSIVCIESILCRSQLLRLSVSAWHTKYHWRTLVSSFREYDVN